MRGVAEIPAELEMFFSNLFPVSMEEPDELPAMGIPIRAGMEWKDHYDSHCQ